MICSSGVGFDPVVSGTRLDFGFHGIWQGTALLYDRQTESLWLHITGECCSGPKKGTKLVPIPGRHLLWREWRRDHPDTEVMAPVAAYAGRYFPRDRAARGAPYFPAVFPPTIKTRDERLALSALCYGIYAGGVARAYPFERLASAPAGLVEDDVGGVPVVIVYDAETRSCAGYGRAVRGRTLGFQRAGDGSLIERESGARFDRAGRCVEGEFAGERLLEIFGLQAEWYGWAAAYPGTTVWGEEVRR